MKIFNFKHPSDVNLTYMEHLRFTWKESARSFVAFLVMFIHGIFPFILDWWYDNHIQKTKKRIDKVNEGRVKDKIDIALESIQDEIDLFRSDPDD